MGMMTISGETTNTDVKDHSYTIIVTFFDENKKIDGTGVGGIENIGPGQTKTFEAISQDSLEHVKNYKVDIDSLLY
jgi:hypothetical protein